MAAAGTAEPEGTLSLNRADNDDQSSVETQSKEDGKRRAYPYIPMVVLMTVTVGQSYAASGLQAVLELYFSTFLYVCSRHAVRLASTSINVYIAVYQICALPGGYLADRVLGNFKTQVVSNLVTSLGICLVLFSSWQYTQEPPACCHWPQTHHNTSSTAAHPGSSHSCSALQVDPVVDGVNFHLPPNLNLTLIILGLLLFAIGYGCTNAIQSVFIADQFPEETSKAKARSFSWYYLFCNVGTLGGELGMPVLRQSVGFIISWITVLGATLPTTALFMFTWCLYIRKKPARAHCSCYHKTRRRLTEEENTPEEDESLENSKETDPLLGEHSSREPATATDSEVVVAPKLSWKARAKQLLPFLGLFTPLVVFWAIFYQQSSTWVVQGTQMNCYIGPLDIGRLHIRRLHVPPDIMPSVNDVLCILIILLLDYLVYPHIETSMNIKLHHIHKLVAGMLCAALSFLMSGLLQLYVHPPPKPCYGDVNLAWQLPQIVLISFAEILVSVTGLELAYSQAPPDLRNLVTALWYIAQALGAVLNIAVVQIPISLLYQFFLYFCLMLLVTALFLAINCRTNCCPSRKQSSNLPNHRQDTPSTKNHTNCH